MKLSNMKGGDGEGAGRGRRGASTYKSKTGKLSSRKDEKAMLRESVN